MALARHRARELSHTALLARGRIGHLVVALLLIFFVGASLQLLCSTRKTLASVGSRRYFDTATTHAE